MHDADGPTDSDGWAVGRLPGDDLGFLAVRKLLDGTVSLAPYISRGGPGDVLMAIQPQPTKPPIGEAVVLERAAPYGVTSEAVLDSVKSLPLAHRQAVNTGGNEARRFEAPLLKRLRSDSGSIGGELHWKHIATGVAIQGAVEQGRVQDGSGAPARRGSEPPESRVGGRCRAAAAGLSRAAAARVRRGRWAWGHAASS